MGEWWTSIYDWPILWYHDIAKNLTKDQFAKKLKNGSDIYENVHILTTVIIIEKYLTLNLKIEPHFICASLIKIQTTVIRPNFITKISLKRLLIFISLLHRHNFRTKHEVSTRLTFPHYDNRYFMSYMITTYFYCFFDRNLSVKFSFSVWL